MKYIILDFIGDYSNLAIVVNDEGEPMFFKTRYFAKKYADENCQEYKIVKLC